MINLHGNARPQTHKKKMKIVDQEVKKVAESIDTLFLNIT